VGISFDESFCSPSPGLLNVLCMVFKGPLRGGQVCSIVIFVLSFASVESHKLVASNSPFLPSRDNTTSEPVHALELRGVVREGGTIYLTFFDAVSKKWTTLSPGEEAAGLFVESFDEANDAATLRIDGRALSFALKGGGAQLRGNRAVAVTPIAATKLMAVPQVARSLEISPDEAHRLDLVANEIRQQLERAKFTSRQVSSPNKS